MDIVILGLSITSSWGNGHATTYRGLVRELAKRGHSILFLERDVPWYASNRDLADPPFCRTCLYSSVDELQDVFGRHVRSADCVIVGSYVPDGVSVGSWVTEESRGVTAFYDIDTPVTLAKISRGDYEYLTPELVGRYDLYLSFTGGPTLSRIESEFGSPAARPLYCSVDETLYFPEASAVNWDMGYLGTYSEDRQLPLEQLLIEPARLSNELRFVVAGPQYPADINWPENLERIEHLPPFEHRRFYNSQRSTLNITRADMVAAGYSPSVRLFEAAACGVPIISDYWEGLDSFFEFGSEILVAESSADVGRYLTTLSDRQLKSIGRRARQKVLSRHTSAHRASELEAYIYEAAAAKKSVSTAAVMMS